jgi:hypothetical protein
MRMLRGWKELMGEEAYSLHFLLKIFSFSKGQYRPTHLRLPA